MPLEQYVEKRHLDKTPEPAGGEPTTGLPKFVVQLHRATRLHYDFRLEAQGVLKSWAIPKGPSMNPDDKRLAVMVEDHPMDYRSFEGIIPKGNYGAGTVMVWDEATYAVPEATTREEIEHGLKLGLHKGHAAFFLSGQKLKGLFDLIKLKGREENAWLLVKRPDEFATADGFEEPQRSVLTGRTMEEIKTGAPSEGKVWYSDRLPQDIDLSGAPEAPMPHGVKPMLAAEADGPSDRKGWLFEVKWDGYRAIAEVELEGDVRLYSRNQLSFNERYPAIVADLKKLGHAAVLDGEVVTVDEQGRAQFQWLQEYGKGKRGTLLYYVFDLLYFDGHDLRRLPTRRRKEILAQIVPAEGRIRFSGHVEGQGCDFYKAISAQELEGMMAKNGACPYEEGRRSRDWLKIKRLHEQMAVIGGFTEGRHSRQHFGALVLGVYDGGDLVYVGHTGGGFDEAGLKSLVKKLEPLRSDRCPFNQKPKTNMPVTWVEPTIVVEVEFRGWTESGHLRQPVFKRLVPDVDPREVRRIDLLPALDAAESEEPAARRSRSQPKDHTTPGAPRTSGSRGSAETKTNRKAKEVAPDGNEPDDPPAVVGVQRFPAKAREETVEIDGHQLKLTNLNKVLWPDDGYTKGNLIDYYRGVAEFILPYLKDRPESLNRHPNGINQQSFFQKDMPAMIPGWLETVEIVSGTQGKKIKYLLCQDEATLVYMANLACIEINPWNSRVPHLARPDYAVIDLDPHEVEFEAVVETAIAIHNLLDEIGVTARPKTSGSRGIHIYVPLGAHYETEQARQFAQLIAQIVHGRLPKITSLERSPARRVGKVYLDFLQNRDGQTLAAAYSTRPKPGATVSIPLSWDEVNVELDPKSFTIRTVLERLDRVGDLWAPVLGSGIDLGSVLEAVQGLAS
jgi:bifunctional non-homologous end joining protein LigD